MPVTLSYPGVYIEEIPSGVRTITGVPTSITAFVGRAWKGTLDEPILCSSYADYERHFGGLWRLSSMSYAVQQFFANGGSQAVVVRTAVRAPDADAAESATIDLGGGTTLAAASPGTWGRNLVVTVDYQTRDKDKPLAQQDANLFNLTVLEDAAKTLDGARKGGSGAREVFLNVSRLPTDPRFVTRVLEQQSSLVRVSAVGAARPAAAAVSAGAATGSDGTIVANAAAAAAEIQGDATAKSGLYALNKTDIFNLLCVPPLVFETGTLPNTTRNEVDVTMSVWTAAANLCKERRALLVVDAPSNWALTGTNAATGTSGVTTFSAIVRDYAALYFPRLRLNDPLQDDDLADFAPCGVVAGVMSRTDNDRGVWKAPAGIEANLRGVRGTSIAGVAAALNDAENGQLNPQGINCLRSFPAIGHVVWGARTLAGADALASDWKYVPVRRLALYIEESLFRGTKWVVFEPNDEPLWAQIRLNIGAFMQNLFRQGAFQGRTPRDAYFVKCDGETTTQNDMNLGVVNILVGFAPLKPAEFVVIRIQQMAGQIEA
ncbi:phage tail sheath C-terminal domain-containing protein [Accumulibacter sp.]|jgi:phage tail sheath protein FI|uniref:phage tail sheath family protein n=1 Tax=Accumulibacter sp. TaxID=2053492 RepID=UPI001ACDC6AA|nr:phage tail sheath C-terminal domain-containing protein [Accumulibacter sp.]MBN8452713.1 phage tail sheath family protein [Accumulibacter sp.]